MTLRLYHGQLAIQIANHQLAMSSYYIATFNNALMHCSYIACTHTPSQPPNSLLLIMVCYIQSTTCSDVLLLHSSEICPFSRRSKVTVQHDVWVEHAIRITRVASYSWQATMTTWQFQPLQQLTYTYIMDTNTDYLYHAAHPCARSVMT